MLCIMIFFVPIIADYLSKYNVVVFLKMMYNNLDKFFLYISLN